MTIPGGTVKLAALFALILVVILAIALIITALLTHHDPTSEPYASWLQTAAVAGVALAGIAGLGGAVQSSHLTITSRLDQLGPPQSAPAPPAAPPPGAA